MFGMFRGRDEGSEYHAAMPRQFLHRHTERLLRGVAHSPLLPLLTGALAFVQTLTFSVPVTVMLVPAVLLGRARWKPIVLLTSLGSAAGATLVVMLFHEWGWQKILAVFPAIVESPAWPQVHGWVSEWGVAGLLAVSALPVPQAPALLFFALGDPDAGAILLAMFAGKLIKYGVIARITIVSPERFGGIRRGFAKRRALRRARRLDR